MVLAVVLLAVSARAEAPAHFFGKGAWDSRGADDQIVLTGGFAQGYFDVVEQKFPWSDTDRRAWANLAIQMVTAWDWRDVNRFYADPANADAAPAVAMRLTLEAAIAKMHDGPRLLAMIGVDPKQSVALATH